MSEVIRLNEDMIGNKVRCIYKADCYHPEIGTIGTIVDYDKYDEDASYKVQWTKGITIGDDRWWAINRYIELVEDDVTNEQKISEMTNKEIWEMLLPKMRKNGLEIAGYLQDYTGEVGCYDEDDVHNAIALSYRSGYERAMKGRPFKFGEKKKKGGHWEPIDPNNLPKEGTRVRYSRQFDDSNYNTFENRTNMKIGEETVVMYGNFGTFGIKPIHGTKEWWCSSSYPDRFDMWVEDDE